MERTSLRQFSPTPVSKEHLKLILDATRQAPTGGNMQMYSIINVTDDLIKEKLSQSCDNQPFIKSGHVLIFCNDMHKWDRAFNLFDIDKEEGKDIDEVNFILSVQDATIAAQNAVVAAESLGIGSCYIGGIASHYHDHKELLNLPDGVFPCCMLVLGYYPDDYTMAPRPRFSEKFMVFENTYTQPTDQDIKDQFKLNTEEATKTWVQGVYQKKISSPNAQERKSSIKEAISTWKKGI